jgi:hypothetical protein
LDAAVPVPAGLRDLLLSCADAEVFRPVWQSELEAEIVRNLVRLGMKRGGLSLNPWCVLKNRGWPDDGVICWFVLVVACRCESGPGSCQEAR